MNRISVFAAISIAVLMVATPAHAHHAFSAQYDVDKPASLTGVVVTDNATNGGGGGIYTGQSQTTTIHRSRIDGNSALFGGGLFNPAAAVLTITDSTVTLLAMYGRTPSPIRRSRASGCPSGSRPAPTRSGTPSPDGPRK